MKRHATHSLGRSLTVTVVTSLLATALLAACAGESPIEPDRRLALPAPSGAASAVAVDLGACDNLQAPAGSTLAYRVYAEGVQIYRWTGTSWLFIAPSAVLFADAGERSTVGTHFGGPTWLSVSGSRVVGAVVDRCTPDASAIPWLLLDAVSAEGPGIFDRVTSIQRVNTVGGTAPLGAGSVTGEERSVPYTAEYLFYRGP